MDALTIAISFCVFLAAVGVLGASVLWLAIWNLGRMGEAMPRDEDAPHTPALISGERTAHAQAA